MKRFLITAVCLAIGFTSLSGCAKTPESTPAEATSATTTSVETTVATTSETTKEDRGHFEFKPVVVSSIFRDIMGEDMYEAYCNYIAAVRAGEDSFEVKDQETYDWMMGQFPYVFYPVVAEYTESNYAGAYSNGRATFQYKIPKEEFAQKNAEFEEIVVNILNENLRDDYSDFEKVLALYIYFATNYTYDYDTYNEMDDHYVDNLSGYRFLTGETGICCECATAFSYLLLQAGVDATCAGGTDHEWSYVTINGKNYHVDPTYAMSSDINLSYLMMTDETREVRDGFPKKNNVIANHYKDDHNGDKYDANDDFFEPLNDGHLISWDPEQNLIYYKDANGDECTFDYSPFG